MDESARGLLTDRVVVAAADARLSDLGSRLTGTGIHYCAVREETDGTFVGLIQLADLIGLSSPGNRILADLVASVPPTRVHPKAAPAEVAALFEKQKLTEAVVVDEKGHYFGLITAQSALEWTVRELRKTEASRAPAPLIDSALPPLRILLVEDNAASSETMAKILRRRGCQVQVAASVAEGLAAADAHRFDLVISDIGLPDGTGYDLMRTLRQKHGLRGIATSGLGSAADVKKTWEAGFEAHLTKPLVISRLEAELKRGPWNQPSAK